MSIGTLFHWKYKQDEFQGYAKHKTWAMTAAGAAGRKGMLFTALLCISTALSAGACVSACTGKSNTSKQCCPQKRKFTIDVTQPLNHRSGKYPPRSWYNVKFTGARIFHAVLSLKVRKKAPSLCS